MTGKQGKKISREAVFRVKNIFSKICKISFDFFEASDYNSKCSKLVDRKGARI